MAALIWHDGDKIRKAREMAGMSRKELADAMRPQVAYGTIRNWETGRSEPTVSQWRRIREVTNVDLLMYPQPRDNGWAA